MDDALTQPRPKPKDSFLAAALVLGFFTNVLLNPEWIYNYAGDVDSWGHFGTLYHPIFMRRAYPSHPIGDLLPLVLPGGLYYSLFSPYFANLFYKLTCFVLSGFFVFKTIRGEFGVRTAVFGTIAFVSSQDFLAATGEDYTNGRVILYFALTLYLTLKAVDLTPKRERVFLALAGAAFACSVSTALLSMVYGTAIAWLYLGKRWQKHGRLDLKCVKNGGFFVIGFAVAILAMCAIHYSYTGKWIYFEATIGKAMSFLKLDIVHAVPLTSLEYDWLAIPCFTLAAAPFLILKLGASGKTIRESVFKNRALLVAVSSAINFGVLLYLQQVKNQQPISDWYWFSQTLPLTFLAMSGVFFAPWIDRLSKHTYAKLTAWFVVLTYVLFWLTTNHHLHTLPFLSFNLQHWIYFTLGFLTLVLLDISSLSISIVMVGFLILNFAPSANNLIHRDYRISELVPSRRVALELTVDWIKLMDRLDPTREAYLWYDRSGQRDHWAGLSAASHYWQGRVYNESFPRVNIVMGEAGVIPPDKLYGQPLLVITDDDKTLQEGLDNLRSIGVEARCQKGEAFVSGGKEYFKVYRCKCDKNESQVR